MALRHRRAARAADEIRGGLDRLLELALMLRPRLKIVLQRRTTLRDEEPHIDHASAVWNGYSLRRRQVEQHPPPFRVRQQCAARAPLRRAKPRPGPLLTSGTGQLAARYASTTDFGMRPRSLTLWPCWRTHSRMAAVSSRFERADLSATVRLPLCPPAAARAAGLASHVDERGKAVAQLGGVLVRKIELIVAAFEAEVEGARCFRPVEVVDELGRSSAVPLRTSIRGGG